MIEDPWEDLVKNNYPYKKYRNIVEMKTSGQQVECENEHEFSKYPVRLLHYTIE